jgi:hypothetical protein
MKDFALAAYKGYLEAINGDSVPCRASHLFVKNAFFTFQPTKLTFG